MGQVSLYCCFLFMQHQSMLDQVEPKMRRKKVDTAGVTESLDHKRVLSFYNMSKPSIATCKECGLSNSFTRISSLSGNITIVLNST